MGPYLPTTSDVELRALTHADGDHNDVLTKDEGDNLLSVGYLYVPRLLPSLKA